MGQKQQPGNIRVEDIEQIRQEMYIGKILEETVYLDKMGERLVMPKIKKMEVCGIYPFLVEIKESGKPPKLPIQTMTYVDLIMQQIKEAKGETNV